MNIKKNPKFDCIRRCVENYIITNEGCLEDCDDLIKDMKESVRILGIDNPIVNRVLENL